MAINNSVYRPHWMNASKYFTYLRYFKEYVRHGDLKSLSASLKYVLTSKLPEKDFVAESPLGKFYIRRNTNDFQFINCTYERSIKDYLVKHMASFDVFIDVGACIGEYDIWLANQGKKCIAIEPVNYRALQSNIMLNKLEGAIKVYKCGLGSKKEKVYFNILDDVTSSSHIDRSSAGKEPNVQIERLDDLVSQFNIRESDSVLIKLDVEGMETDVIEGAAAFLRKCRSVRIIYEHFWKDEDPVNQLLSRIASFRFIDLDEVNRLAVKTA